MGSTRQDAASGGDARTRSGPMAGRTVLVTGGTGGIGKATALGLTMLMAYRQRSGQRLVVGRLGMIR